METNSIRKAPAVVYKDGKPTAVILDIEDYEELLEKIEDWEDLQAIEEIKKRKQPEYVPLEDYLKELGLEDV